MKLRMNELGLLRTEDSLWGIRQINEHAWALQHRNDPDDPWDWQVVSHESSLIRATMRLKKLIEANIDTETTMLYE